MQRKSKPNQADHIEEGHLIHLRIFDGSTTRDRIIQICSGTEGDHTRKPPCHSLDSEFVAPFLGKPKGFVTSIAGSVASQSRDYEATLVAILQPGDSYDPTLIDSYDQSGGMAA